ncbi:MAG: zinc ribbon domain-containing protein [Clostridia bacterium]|nr:zinc ribbon domain-containing protein [Clostridia bacterium]
MGEYLAFLPLVIALIGMGVILYFTVSSRGRNSIMKNMMKSNMDVLKDMTTGDMGERLKDLSKTAINVKKEILTENQDVLKEMAEMEAEIEKGAIRTKAQAVKEGFGTTATMYCKHCGTSIDSDSRFCKKCGKAQ